jgi:hypothetical protein
MPNEKLCARCKLPKPATTEVFKPAKAMRDGLDSWCRDCRKAYDRERGQLRKTHDKPGRPPKLVIDGKLTCGTCKEPKPATDEFFARDANTPSGFRSRCKTCDSVAAAGYYNRNQDKRIANAASWNQANPERYYANKKESDKRCRPRINRQRSERRAADPQFRIGLQLRSRLANAIRAQLDGREDRGRGASAVRDLGCTLEELTRHLEARFQPGMSWDNYGSAWHVDHVTPLAWFDLTNADQCREACRFTNLQPLWGPDNLKKGAR